MKRADSIVMAVYNHVATDGRVQRAARTLAVDWDVSVVGLGSISSRVPFKYVEMNPVGTGGVGLIEFTMRFLIHCIRTRPSIVYAHDYYLAGPGLLAARLTGAKFVYDAHELIATRSRESTTTRNSLFFCVERLSASRADLVIAANSARARLMTVTHGLAGRPMVVENLPQSEPDLELAVSPDECESYRLLYQGFVSQSRGLTRLLEALLHLPAEIQLSVLGEGPDLEGLKQRAHTRGLSDRVHFLGKVPVARMRELMARAHVGILAYPAPDLNNRYCAPNKVYEYAQQGLPMLGVGSRHLKRVVEGAGIGRVIGPTTSPAALAAALQEVLAEWDEFNRRCLAFAREMTWERQGRTLIEGVREVRERHP